MGRSIKEGACSSEEGFDSKDILGLRFYIPASIAQDGLGYIQYPLGPSIAGRDYYFCPTLVYVLSYGIKARGYIVSR